MLATNLHVDDTVASSRRLHRYSRRSGNDLSHVVVVVGFALTRHVCFLFLIVEKTKQQLKFNQTIGRWFERRDRTRQTGHKLRRIMLNL